MILHGEDVGEVFIETLRPKSLAVGHSHKSHCYSKTIARSLQVAVQYRIHSLLSTSRDRILLKAGILPHGAGGPHHDFLKSAKSCNQSVSHSQQIGRASCRERVEHAVVAAAVKEKHQ